VAQTGQPFFFSVPATSQERSKDRCELILQAKCSAPESCCSYSSSWAAWGVLCPFASRLCLPFLTPLLPLSPSVCLLSIQSRWQHSPHCASWRAWLTFCVSCEAVPSKRPEVPGELGPLWLFRNLICSSALGSSWRQKQSLVYVKQMNAERMELPSLSPRKADTGHGEELEICFLEWGLMKPGA
jgi:hypothetical protein